MQLAKEEAERANHAKSDFLSRMSHELRTPLNAILGFAQLMQMGGKTTDHRENLGHILNAGRHLLKLINEVLDIAAIEAGRLELTIEDFSAGEIVERAIEMSQPLAAKREIRIFWAKGERYVRADQQRLEQVLLNLLSNAIKYNREGGRVVVAVEEESTRTLRIAVSDTGPGIPQRGIEKLFASFERLEAGKTQVEGTGLGLAVCKQFVELMGGQIGVESTVGKGSTFWLRLPRGEKPGLPAAPADPQPLPEPGAEKYTLLYVEDNAVNLTLLQRILDRRGEFNFLTAVDGGQGFDMAREFQPDLILLDLFLPDMSGEEVLAKLRQCEETAHIPVIVFSADATAGQAERLLAAGAQEYLTKPLEVADLLLAIRRVLARA
jgi:CheY-like chemotaxis protein/anti-sigma regulatory factor (Ser/Thr protein kinase)